MSERTNPGIASLGSQNWETWFVVGSVSLLSALAVVDRFFAWLIGEFPTSSLLWQIRFEYLRPIAVYYHLAEFNLGSWSPWTFSVLVVAAAALIAGGALCRIRLVRAVSYHLFLAVAATLIVLCFDSSLSIRAHAVIGTPSDSYFLLGCLLALITTVLCLRVHAEYLGWNPRSLRIVRRLRISIIRIRADIEAAAIDVIEQLSPASRELRAALIRPRADRRRENGAQ